MYNRGRIFAKKVDYDGIRFDSEQECVYYKQLKQRTDIKDLEVHKSYVLQNVFVNSNGKTHKAITYEPDFVYYDLTDNKWHFVDVKGFVTEEFALKWKMFDKWLIDHHLDCYLEVLKYSKTTGFVPIEKYKEEMKSRQAKTREERNYYKNIVMKQRHEKEMAERKEQRERARLDALIAKRNLEGNLTYAEKKRLAELIEKYYGVNHEEIKL